MAYNRGFGGGYRGGGGGFRGRSFGGPREMHKIKCSECGKDAEVPFKPREDGTPVYCRDCYFKKKGITPRESSTFKKEEAPKKEETEEVESEEGEESDEEEF